MGKHETETAEEWWREEDVTFYSDGSRVWGRLYIPKVHRAGERRAAWVTANGFTNTWQFLGSLPGVCKRLTRHGYIAILFDFHGFGDSRIPGRTPMVDPIGEASDAQSAITYLQTREEVDESRIGMIGWSFGGTLTPYVAAIDDRVAAAVAVGGIGDGRRWLKSLRSHAAWQSFLKEIEEDRRQTVLTGRGRVVPTRYIMPTEGASQKWLEDETTKGYHGGDILLQTAEKIMYFKPEEYVHLISPRPILYVTSPENPVVNAEEIVSMYEKSREPKALWLLPRRVGVGSPYGAWHDMAEPSKPHLELDTIIDWMKKCLPNHVSQAGDAQEAPELGAGYSSKLKRGTWLKV